MIKKTEEIGERKERLLKEIQDYEQKLRASENELEEIKATEYAANVEKVNDLIEEYEIRLTDLEVFKESQHAKVSRRSEPRTSKPKNKPQQLYRNPETGETHSGKGKLPPWLEAAIISDKGVSPRTFKPEFCIEQP